MVPLGLFPALAATVKLILIQMNTGECLGIGPLPSHVHSPGGLADKQPFANSSSRERRNIQCQQGYYPHPDKTHCCMLCHKGTYVVKHCESEDRTSTCRSCPEGTFNEWENFAETCSGCQSCRTDLGQVPVTSCSNIQDTVCSCSSNYYRTKDSPDSLCMPCSACHNGTVLKECSAFSNTVCRCHKGFFLQTRKNRCSPCSSCQGEECKEDCDVMIPSRLPPNSTDLTPILGGLVFLFAAAILLLAVRQLVKPPVRKKLMSAFSRCRSEQQTSPADPQLPQPEVKVDIISQESNQKEMLLPPGAAAPAPAPPCAQALPDCVPPPGETRLPDCPEVLYAVIENVPFTQWKEFVRRLGLSENDIDRIQVEEYNMRDAQYKMLKFWRQQSGQRATVERMSSVLKEMELSGCNEAILEVLSRQA